MNLGIILSIVTISVISVTANPFMELRFKVGDVLEKLKHPNKLEKISEFTEDAIFNSAVDFTSSFKPKFIQMALIPKNGPFSSVTFDMEYKESASKATLNLNLKKLRPDLIELGSEYLFKIFASDGKEQYNWEFGLIKMPKSIDYKLPEIEDNFYKMPEIYTPENVDESEGGKRNIIYPVIGLIISVILPWISFIKMWKISGSNFSIPDFLMNNSKSRAFPFFSLSLLALFILIISAWVFLSIFQTLGFLTVLSSTVFVFGHRSFKTLVQSEEKQKEQEKSEKYD